MTKKQKTAREIIGKGIKLDSSNPVAVAKLEAAFAAANGRAKANTLSPSDALDSAECAEARLEGLGLSKRDRVGAENFYLPAGPAKSYRHRMRSTRYRIARRSSGWYLIELDSVELWPETRGKDDLWLTPDQAERVRAKYFTENKLQVRAA